MELTKTDREPFLPYSIHIITSRHCHLAKIAVEMATAHNQTSIFIVNLFLEWHNRQILIS